MSWCPKCKSEFRDGFTVCSDCGVPLVAWYPKDEDDLCAKIENPCILATVNDVPDLEVLLEQLKAANIPAFIKDDLTVYNIPNNYLGDGLIQGVCVNECHLDEAKRLLADSIKQWEAEFPNDCEVIDADEPEAPAPVSEDDGDDCLDSQEKVTKIFLYLLIGLALLVVYFVLCIVFPA